MNTWIVVVNRREAKIFEYDNIAQHEVEFVRKLDNPKGRLRAQEINADKPGVFSSQTIHGPRLVKAETPVQHVAQEFAKRVTNFLEDSLDQHLFDDLIIIAEHHFLGRLRHLFSKELESCVVKEIPKDLYSVTREDLKNRLWPETNLFL
ncbi:MAG: host attachment protein [Bdellovibrio sp.]